MGMITRFTDIMSANVNAVLSKSEEKNADKLLRKYLQDAKENLKSVKAETAAVMAEETAARRKLDECVSSVAKYEQYAISAVKAGNDVDARKFLTYKSEAENKKAALTQDLERAGDNSDKMRKMTAKLSEDINEADSRIRELESKLAIAKSQEKRAALTQKGGIGDMDSMMDKLQKRIDTADAMSTLNTQSSEQDELEKKYASMPVAESSIEDELARLKQSTFATAPATAATADSQSTDDELERLKKQYENL